jgi:hypothetical protein
VALVAALVAGAFATNCLNGESPMACTLEARAGINVAVVDAATGAAITNATVVAREGAFTETLTSFQAGEHFGVFEREGTYEVTNSAPGRQTWRADRVVVGADECHVIPVRLTARLEPA